MELCTCAGVFLREPHGIFPSKDDIVSAVLCRKQQDWNATLNARVGATGEGAQSTTTIAADPAAAGRRAPPPIPWPTRHWRTSPKREDETVLERVSRWKRGVFRRTGKRRLAGGCQKAPESSAGQCQVQGLLDVLDQIGRILQADRQAQESIALEDIRERLDVGLIMADLDDQRFIVAQ